MLDDRPVLTVPQAARRIGRNPETVRRWIREGKLRSRRIGMQHLVEQHEVDALVKPRSRALPVENGDKPTPWGGGTWQDLADDIVATVRELRGPLYIKDVAD